ncbi:MAG: hypothetical protein BWY03_00061 [Parcubacteria group bacterium ADurb.Bin159]|nr:MAG: hypothetical protein BWY03_00061 [Parcubacteria group bacterium ADurb.Bin159]
MELEELFKKIKDFKESDKIDLSSKEDLAVAIMNLISLEEHLFFTYNKTNDKKYLEILNETRELRKKYLAQIVKNPEGEIWCISKHLLSASMRFMEVGTKKLNEGRKEEAEELFKKSYDLWNIFWGINLNLIDVKDVKAINSDGEINLDENEKVSIFSKLGKVVQKILDCCKE